MNKCNLLLVLCVIGNIGAIEEEQQKGALILKSAIESSRQSADPAYFDPTKPEKISSPTIKSSPYAAENPEPFCNPTCCICATCSVASAIAGVPGCVACSMTTDSSILLGYSLVTVMTSVISLGCFITSNFPTHRAFRDKWNRRIYKCMPSFDCRANEEESPLIDLYQEEERDVLDSISPL